MLKESLKNILEGTSPRFLSDNLEYYEDHMKTFANRMDKIIDDILFQIDFSEVLCFGFPMKMDCWIVSSIIARKIKEIDSEMPIVIGEVSTKKMRKHFYQALLNLISRCREKERRPYHKLLKLWKIMKRIFLIFVILLIEILNQILFFQRSQIETSWTYPSRVCLS